MCVRFSARPRLDPDPTRGLVLKIPTLRPATEDAEADVVALVEDEEFLPNLGEVEAGEGFEEALGGGFRLDGDLAEERPMIAGVSRSALSRAETLQ